MKDKYIFALIKVLSLVMTMIKVVIFDLDDTLIKELDYVKSGFEVVAKITAKKYDLDKDKIFRDLNKFFQENSKNVFNRLLEAYNIEYLSKDILELVDAYRNHQPQIKLFDDVLEVLKILKDDGIKLGIITDGYESSQKAKIKVLKLDKLIDKIVITDTLGKDYWKPSSKAFEIVKEYFNVQYEEMIYVADNANKDFIAPEKLGMQWVQIKRPDCIYQQTINPNISNLYELIKIIKGN